MLVTFRDTVRKISPPWLQRGVAEKLLYALAIQIDACADALVAGVKLRFPGVYSDESLPLLGRERRIARGRLETNVVYASRLARWLDDHRRRGGPYALLLQLFAHYAPNNFHIQLVYRSGRRFQLDVAGAITRDEGGGFGPFESPEQWARWWLFYDWPDAVTTDGTWDDLGDWGDGGVWDSSLSPQDVADLRLVPHEWNAAHCFGALVLLCGGAELWDYPVGTWDDAGTWGQGVVVELDVE